MKIVFIHNDPQMQAFFKQSIFPEHEVTVLNGIDTRDKDFLSALVRTGAELIILQLGLLGSATAPFVILLKRVATAQVWVISGSMDFDLAADMLRVGVDKAFNSINLSEHLQEAGLMKKTPGRK